MISSTKVYYYSYGQKYIYNVVFFFLFFSRNNILYIYILFVTNIEYQPKTSFLILSCHAKIHHCLRIILVLFNGIRD